MGGGGCEELVIVRELAKARDIHFGLIVRPKGGRGWGWGWRSYKGRIGRKKEEQNENEGHPRT
jgi:hypothetical protein